MKSSRIFGNTVFGNTVFSILITVALAFFANVAIAVDDDKPDNKYPNRYYYKQFQEAFERIQRDYVQEPDFQEMVDEAINGMLRSLDPYSGYYTDEDLDFFLDQTDG